MSWSTRRRTIWIVVLAAAAALGIRCWFVASVTVDTPVRGDARDYVAYATNIVRYHVFSGAPGKDTVTPDSYRDPGYPAFLAPWIAWIPDAAYRYRTIEYVQAVLSALTVALYLIIARQWMSLRWLAVTAAILCTWPHLVTMTAYLLSETLVGFLVAAGLACIVGGTPMRRSGWPALGALIFGCAALTNAVLIPFLPAVAIVGWLSQPNRKRYWCLMLCVSLAPPACWALRSVSVDSGLGSGSRAMINLMEGSWPQYHDAWAGSLRGNVQALATSEQVSKTVSLALANRDAGFADIARRFHASPAAYTGWYLSKPALLWGWRMRIAAAPLYVFPTRNSPLDSSEVASKVVNGLRWLNPWLGLAALLGCAVALTEKQTQDKALLAALVVYVTVVYGILQSEPRYSVPFRGAEILLAVLGVAKLTAAFASGRRQFILPSDKQ